MWEMTLDGSWSFRKVGADTSKEGTVPGSLLADLLDLNEISDPYYRDQEYPLLELFDDDYEYFRSFMLTEEEYASQDHELIFQGLDTLAEVFLNGQLILKSDNMFRTYSLKVKDQLIVGKNEVLVRFSSPVKYMKEKAKKQPLFGIPMVVEGYTHLRKAHYMSGWDWGPKLPDYGIWRSVTLVGSSSSRWDDILIQQIHKDGKVHLQLDFSITNSGVNTKQAEIELLCPNGKVINTEITIEQKGRGQAELLIEQPELWWPNGFGDQPLYKVVVRLKSKGSICDERRYQLGLRSLTVNTEKDQWGNQFAFEINGIKIFSMGADYIPEDNLIRRMTRERTERLIQDCVKANFNTIRVWGGGFYPDDYFYELCDQYGLIIWQDFMFSCGVYPLSPSFIKNSICEIEDNVKRIRHHASIGLFCGNNEIEMFFEDGTIADTPENRAEYVAFFEQNIPKMLEDLAPDVFYWPGSPSSGGDFFETNSENYGDGHYWEVWHNNKPFTEYRKTFFRYASEFGFESMPHQRTIEAFTLPEDRNLFSYVMESHQKNPDGNQKILAYLSETFRYPKDFSSLVYVSQLMQAEAMRYGIEHWRRHRGRCMGTLYWQLNDCWPTLSWASIDYYGRWKALHYLAKRFYAPLLVSACEEGNEVSLHVTNETRQDVQGKLRWTLCDMKHQTVEQGERQVSIEALNAKQIVHLNFSEQIAHRKMELYLAFYFEVDEVEVSQGTAFFAPLKYLKLQKVKVVPNIEEKADRFEISLSSRSFAKFVELSFHSIDGIFSDNYFDLTSRTRVISLLKSELPSSITHQDIVGQLVVRSLVDSYE